MVYHWCNIWYFVDSAWPKNVAISKKILDYYTMWLSQVWELDSHIEWQYICCCYKRIYNYVSAYQQCDHAYHLFHVIILIYLCNYKFKLKWESSEVSRNNWTVLLANNTIHYIFTGIHNIETHLFGCEIIYNSIYVLITCVK